MTSKVHIRNEDSKHASTKACRIFEHSKCKRHGAGKYADQAVSDSCNLQWLDVFVCQKLFQKSNIIVRKLLIQIYVVWILYELNGYKVWIIYIYLINIIN